MSHWVTFEDNSQGCVSLQTSESPVFKGKGHTDANAWKDYNSAIIEAVRVKAEALGKGKVIKIESLPYPADPQLGTPSSCPSFCWQPKKCAGYSSCPRLLACSE